MKHNNNLTEAITSVLLPVFLYNDFPGKTHFLSRRDFISPAPLSEHKQLFSSEAKVCGQIQYTRNTHKHLHINSNTLTHAHTYTQATSLSFCIDVILRANLIVGFVIALVLCSFLLFGVWLVDLWVCNLTMNKKMSY